MEKILGNGLIHLREKQQLDSPEQGVPIPGEVGFGLCGTGVTGGEAPAGLARASSLARHHDSSEPQLRDTLIA